MPHAPRGLRSLAAALPQPPEAEGGGGEGLRRRWVLELLFGLYLLPALRTPEAYELSLPRDLPPSSRDNLSAVALGVEQLVLSSCEQRLFTPAAVNRRRAARPLLGRRHARRL